MTSVTIQAMKRLTNRVNHDAGLTHPNDKATVVGLFRLLVAGGEPFEPSELRDWATQNGWSTNSTTKLYEWTTGILHGRVIRTNGSGGWKPDILERLRESA